MFKLSKMTDYGVILLCSMAQRPDCLSTAPDLAARTLLPAPMVAKVLKALGKAEIVTATRGAQGGYMLSRVPTRITVAEIITALDGPVALTACVEGSDESCAAERTCPLAGGWNRINLAVKTALDTVTLADLMAESRLARSDKMTAVSHTAATGQ